MWPGEMSFCNQGERSSGFFLGSFRVNAAALPHTLEYSPAARGAGQPGYHGLALVAGEGAPGTAGQMALHDLRHHRGSLQGRAVLAPGGGWAWAWGVLWVPRKGEA